ncbi:Ataxin-3 [Orchesella cincta]|uniref:ubiquitinyl hydrolase 1 n=1 Tax=Orchesella cincta TaxID=48709 RepID=A0A1D2MXG7_ORCCI|nr:Ataxin-3 [Orchesella cincta]
MFQQDGALCGQHCLNNALQSSLFSAVDLSEIARQLDEKERQTMAERGTDTKEYREFIANPSSNFDDSGYFSVQVLSEALGNMNLELVSFQSDDSRAAKARNAPVEERLFVCHMEDHWFSMRKFGQQWVNLNSTLTGPELLTDTYFNMLLSTLQNEGGRLFVVFGELPFSEADEVFSNLRRTEDGSYFDDGEGHRLGSDQLDEATAMERGLRLSLAKTPAEAVRAQRAAFLSRFTAPTPAEAASNQNSAVADQKN